MATHAGWTRKLTEIQFLGMFPGDSEFGVDTTDDHVHTYYRNGDEVGRLTYNRRTTVSTYDLLDRETSAAAIYYYTAKTARETKDAAIIAQIRVLAGKMSDEGRVALFGKVSAWGCVVAPTMAI